MRHPVIRTNRDGFQWPTWEGEPCPTCLGANTIIMSTIPAMGIENWKCKDCSTRWTP